MGTKVCVRVHVPKSPIGAVGAAAGHVQLEDNALISSLRAGSASPAVRPRLSATSTPLAASLDSSHLIPGSSRWNPPHMNLAISPSAPLSLQDVAPEQGESHVMAVGRTNQPCLPDKSRVWQCPSLSVPRKVQFSMEQLSGFWLPVRNGSCGLFFPSFTGHCWKICGSPGRRSVSVAVDACYVRVALLSRKHSLFVRRNLEICACE